MRFAIIENGVCINAIEAESEFAREIGAIRLPEGFGAGDRFINGAWAKKPAPPAVPKTEAEKLADYENTVNALIHEKYSVDNEQAITRKIIANPTDAMAMAEFAEYNTFAETCKIQAHAQIY